MSDTLLATDALAAVRPRDGEPAPPTNPHIRELAESILARLEVGHEGVIARASLADEGSESAARLRQTDPLERAILRQLQQLDPRTRAGHQERAGVPRDATGGSPPPVRRRR